MASVFINDFYVLILIHILTNNHNFNTAIKVKPPNRNHTYALFWIKNPKPYERYHLFFIWIRIKSRVNPKCFLEPIPLIHQIEICNLIRRTPTFSTYKGFYMCRKCRGSFTLPHLYHTMPLTICLFEITLKS